MASFSNASYTTDEPFWLSNRDQNGSCFTYNAQISAMTRLLAGFAMDNIICSAVFHQNGLWLLKMHNSICFTRILHTLLYISCVWKWVVTVDEGSDCVMTHSRSTFIFHIQLFSNLLLLSLILSLSLCYCIKLRVTVLLGIKTAWWFN